MRILEFLHKLAAARKGGCCFFIRDETRIIPGDDKFIEATAKAIRARTDTQNDLSLIEAVWLFNCREEHEPEMLPLRNADCAARLGLSSRNTWRICSAAGQRHVSTPSDKRRLQVLRRDLLKACRLPPEV